MTIRYMSSNGVYFSLNDVADLLCDECILTTKQNKIFRTQCQAYVNKELARAYKNKQVSDTQQPVILPFGDYFIHCAVWETLLTLLPKGAAQERKINYLGYMLSEPDSVHRYPATFNAVDLICMPRRAVSQSVKTLPGPLVLEKRDN